MDILGGLGVVFKDNWFQNIQLKIKYKLLFSEIFFFFDLNSHRQNIQLKIPAPPPHPQDSKWSVSLDVPTSVGFLPPQWRHRVSCHSRNHGCLYIVTGVDIIPEKHKQDFCTL